MGLTLSPDAFRAWVKSCVENLGEARAEIDALNVFPVPDGDTGTNAYLTFVAGAEALDAVDEQAELGVLVKAFADGMLTGAKGNCGVILSQLVRAFVHELDEEFELDATGIARCFSAGARAGYAAVGRPVEGTILTVAAAAAEGAASAAAVDGDVRHAFSGAASAARQALARTPMQLERLAQAGVVDSGGRALVVVLDSTEQRLTGRVPDRPAPLVPTPLADDTGADLVAGGPQYEVMYLLEADDDRIAALRAALDGLGDSLVVVGGDRLWNVHVHVDDVGAAIEAGLAAGRPYRIAVTHFAEQIARQAAPQRGRRRAVITAVTGDGLAELCREAGADVLEFTRAHALTVEDMRKALRAADADEIVALPNNQRFRGLFEAAAQEFRAEGVRVAVLPSLAQVQGLAALAVHDPGIAFDDDVVAMSSAAAAVKHGAVTIAAEPGITMAGPCQVGDALGIVSGEFSVVSPDLAAAACDVVASLLTPGSELVTLVCGVGGTDELAAEVEAFVRQQRVDLDVAVYHGGQENYPLFIAVE